MSIAQTKHNLNIRAAKSTDAERIKRLVFSVLEEYGLQPDPECTDRDLDDIDNIYHGNGGFFGVAEHEGRMVATLGICRMDAVTCELRKMYLHTELRGKGLGKELLDYSLAKARKLQFQRVVLETATPLVEAIALYRKYGFRKYCPKHMSARCDQAFELAL